MSICVFSKNSTITNDKIELFCNSNIFDKYISSIKEKKDIEINSIELLDIFCPGKNPLFAYIKADLVSKKSRKPIPGYSFLRPDSCAILVFAHDEDDNIYLPMVRQIRANGGGFVNELIAGCVDEGTFSSAALKECNEEANFSFTSNDLTLLGTQDPTIGGTREKIGMFYTKIYISKEDIEERKNKIYGLEVENEYIHLIFPKIEEYFECPSNFDDGKLHSAMGLFLPLYLSDTDKTNIRSSIKIKYLDNLISNKCIC